MVVSATFYRFGEEFSPLFRRKLPSATGFPNASPPGECGGGLPAGPPSAVPRSLIVGRPRRPPFRRQRMPIAPEPLRARGSTYDGGCRCNGLLGSLSPQAQRRGKIGGKILYCKTASGGFYCQLSILLRCKTTARPGNRFRQSAEAEVERKNGKG